MKEPGELEKLNAVAKAQSNPGSPLFTYLGFMLVIAGFVWVDARLVWHVRPDPRVLSVGFALMFILFAVDKAMVSRTVHLGRSAKCTSERERIQRWLSLLSQPGRHDKVIQFSANPRLRSYQTISVFEDLVLRRSGITRELVRVLVDGPWIAVAVFSNEDFTKLRDMFVFDSRQTPPLYHPSRKSWRIGRKKFQMVDFTPELSALEKSLAPLRAD
jgi:hypothetical protein